jgi:hypothetical protein
VLPELSGAGFELAIGKARFENLENEHITPYLLQVRLAVSDI